MSSDLLSALIDAAVERAFATQLPKLLEAAKASIPAPQASPVQQDDRFVRMAEAARLLGVNRATIWKWERAGKIPPRRHIGSAVGYLMSDIKRIQRGDATSPIVDGPNAHRSDRSRKARELALARKAGRAA